MFESHPELEGVEDMPSLNPTASPALSFTAIVLAATLVSATLIILFN